MEKQFHKALERKQEMANESMGPMSNMMTPISDAKLDIGEQFNKTNEHLGMYYSPSIYEDFVALYNLVVKRLHIQKSSEQIDPFTGDVEYTSFQC